MINKCLFPAAGYGTRFLPDPKDTPANMSIMGRYILTPDIFDRGSIDGFVEATNYFYDKSK